jgi:hypothetical protein
MRKPDRHGHGTQAPHPARPAERPAAPHAGGRSAQQLDRLVAAADDLERSLEVLEAAPGAREAALAELAKRRAAADYPSPFSTAVLVRLAGRIGGREGLVALIPFLADGNPLVQVEAAEALDATPFAELRAALERLAREQPAGGFWEAVVGLLEAREERGICRLVAELADRLASPAALAAVLEALPYLAAPDEAAAVRKVLDRFAADTRAVPGAETEEGPVTLGLVAAQACETLEDDDR